MKNEAAQQCRDDQPTDTEEGVKLNGWALYQYGIDSKDWAIATDDEAARRCLNEHYGWPEVLMGEVSVITPDQARRIPWVDEDGQRIGSLWDAALRAMSDASESGVDAMHVGSTEY